MGKQVELGATGICNHQRQMLLDIEIQIEFSVLSNFIYLSFKENLKYFSVLSHKDVNVRVLYSCVEIPQILYL